ncbi:MAG: DUF3090 family protein [Acidimicrobiales bacterium]
MIEEHESFDLPSPHRFTAGTIGEPGHRVFFLQAVGDAEVVTLKLEKQQVGALAEYLARLLADLPTPADQEVESVDVAFEASIGPAWAVGTLGVAWDESSDRVVLVAEELVDDEAAEAAEEPAATDDVGSARFRLTRAQVAAFVAHARELFAAGRPPCYLCGMPMDADGHACPRLN